MSRPYIAMPMIVGVVLLVVGTLAVESPGSAIGKAFSGMPPEGWTWMFMGGTIAVGAWLWMAVVPRDS